MMNKHYSKPLFIGGNLKSIPGKLSMLLLTLVLVGLTAFGCTARGAQPQGWSGVTVAEEAVFFGSMKGKIIALNKSVGSSVWEVILETPKSSGSFGCAPASNSATIYGTPVVADDLVYVGSYLYVGSKAYGKVYAFNTTSGAARWVYPRQGNLDGAVIGGLAMNGGNVYFGTADGKVYALDAETGDLKWDTRTGGGIWSTPVIDGNTLYIGSLDKKFYALDVTNGNQKWTPFEIGGAIATTPAVDNNLVYFGSFDKHFYAVEAASGKLKWRSPDEAGSWFWSKPVIVNDVVYAACLDGKVYAFDAQTGHLVADMDLGSPISSSPVLIGSSVIVTTEAGLLFSLDTSRNQAKLLVDIQELDEEELSVYSPLAASDGIVFIHGQTKKYGSYLYALDAGTGARVWRYPLQGSK